MASSSGASIFGIGGISGFSGSFPVSSSDELLEELEEELEIILTGSGSTTWGTTSSGSTRSGSSDRSFSKFSVDCCMISFSFDNFPESDFSSGSGTGSGCMTGKVAKSSSKTELLKGSAGVKGSCDLNGSEILVEKASSIFSSLNLGSDFFSFSAEELDELDEELEEDFFLSIFSGFCSLSDFDKNGSTTASLTASLTAVKALEKSSANEFSIFVSPTWLIIFSFFSFSGSRSLSEDSGISGTGMVSSGGFGRGLSGA